MTAIAYTATCNYTAHSVGWKEWQVTKVTVGLGEAVEAAHVYVCVCVRACVRACVRVCVC